MSTIYAVTAVARLFLMGLGAVVALCWTVSLLGWAWDWACYRWRLRFPVPARRCGWCYMWASATDEARASEGVPVSHSCCPRCETRLYADSGVTRPAA